MRLSGDYFYGNKISDYGLEHGFLDYGTLAKAFNSVLNNCIIPNTWDIGEWEQVSGDADEEQEIFQYYIVTDSGAEILQEIGEIVFYNYELDMYIWGVTHYGTSWDYVLTDVPCRCGYDVISSGQEGES